MAQEVERANNLIEKKLDERFDVFTGMVQKEFESTDKGMNKGEKRNQEREEET